MRVRARRRGVALVQALIVVAGLAALAAAALAVAARGTGRLALATQAAQAAAYLDAGLDQARAELAQVLAGGPVLGPASGWNPPRDVAIGQGRVAWQAQDLQGRFNLTWLSLEGPPGDAARAAFDRLAQAAGLAPALTDQLIRALGPDDDARAAAFDAGAPPPLPLAHPVLLGAVARPADGGAAALARLWPLVATLPLESRWNPLTAPLPVLQALIPGVPDPDWALFDAARQSGELTPAEAVLFWAAAEWSEEAREALAALPLGAEAAWIALDLTATLDGIVLRRSVTLSVGIASDGRPDLAVVLSLPIYE